MTTRLDRLFVLLDTGSTTFIRKCAAEQLGQVQRLHPQELNNLLNKVYGYISSSSWETRVAAGQAIQAIVRNVPQWGPDGTSLQDTKNETDELPSPRHMFQKFDIKLVINEGASLLASEGRQFEDNCASTDIKEVIAKQRAMLNKRLGLNNGLSYMSASLFSDDDLCVDKITASHDTPQIAASVIMHKELARCKSMSARELHVARRKAKLVATQTSKDNSNEDGEPSNKKQKRGNTLVMSDLMQSPSNTPTAHIFNTDESDEWPFEGICEVLTNDLFSSVWETRHGAATALREIIRYHGRGAGKTTDTPTHAMSIINELWLSDLILRLLSVLALDRFGDFVSDEVVAPVRETCAQTLGVVLRLLPRDGVLDVTHVLLELLTQNQWEIRHGGLLGLKYCLAVRQDMTEEVLPVVLPAILLGLEDRDDDVRAVSAASLTSVTASLTSLMPKQVPGIVACLWTILLDLDDLTSSTNSIMSLLSSLISHPLIAINNQLTEKLCDVAPRLFPFFTHNVASVRLSSMTTFHTLLTNAQPKLWLPGILTECLRHIYQRALLEDSSDMLVCIEKVWKAIADVSRVDHLTSAAMDYLPACYCLAMQHPIIPFDMSVFVCSKYMHKDSIGKEKISRQIEQKQQYIGGIDGVSCAYNVEGDVAITRARVTTSRMLGLMCATITQHSPHPPTLPERPIDLLCKLHVFYFSSKSALQRFVIAQSLMAWAMSQKPCECDESVKQSLLSCLSESLYYDEVTSAFTRMHTECSDFINSLRQAGVNMDQRVAPNAVLSLDQAMTLATSLFTEIQIHIPARHQEKLEERRRHLHSIVSQTYNQQLSYTLRVQASVAGAVTALGCLPEKLNPVVRPLMDSIRKENNAQLQRQSAESLRGLVEMCIDRDPSPNSKIIKNLCLSLCSDSTFTPPLHVMASSGSDDSCTTHSGILTFTSTQKVEAMRGRRPGPKPCQSLLDCPVPVITDSTNDTVKSTHTECRGAALALSLQSAHFGEHLPERLPTLWQHIIQPLDLVSVKIEADDDEQETREDTFLTDLIQSLQLIETLMPSLNMSLTQQIVERLPAFADCLKHKYTAIRHMTARAIAAICHVCTVETMTYVIENILPSLEVTDNETNRQGTIEVIAHIIDTLGLELVPYLVMLVVPVMGSMSDHNTSVRLMSTQCFANLITLMPLETGIKNPPEMKESLVQQRIEERHFLEQLLDSSKVDDFIISVEINAKLRQYQQDGVNWLAFLQKYKLHGILCDDMGLGKTLMSICILASDHHNRHQLNEGKKSEDCSPLPSLVICPPSLTGHWIYETNKFVSCNLLSPLHYTGSPADRLRLQSQVNKHNVIVASYDLVRNDLEFFSSIKWNYCILDEGHIIKNSKTKITKAVKQLIATHRLILSGTPIQNNVLDLWSLFDFLMPGYLGSERCFQARYGRPILQSRDSKSDSKDQEAGALAMESLHRQVLPFILRRLKQDVLSDLPPKIIQDYYCDMSPLQMLLYEDFAQSQAKKTIDGSVLPADDDKQKAGMHVFQSLQYLRKVCNHPAMVLTRNHPKYDDIMATIDAKSLHDIQHAPKLTALKQLLLDCGIGASPGDSGMVPETPVVSQHRALIFCQLQSMLDIVDKDLLRVHLPTVTYLRLDGRVAAAERHALVHRFNNDPSIDLLLLTTHIGGMGLNLTGADTVIFVEHDWNPMKDLQAMDRAHRIGQKRVVNVYRLVTRGTLEDKIMGLQKFKMTIANTVISSDNSSLSTMGTNQLLDLFTLDSGKAPNNQQDLTKDSAKQTMKSVIDNLDQLWETSLYEEEYNLDTFMQSLYD